MATLQAARQPARFLEPDNHILAALPDAERAMVGNYLRDVDLPAQTVICQRGETADHVYFPRQGIVSLVVPLANGVGIETAMIGPDGAVGSLAVLGIGRAPAGAVIRVDTRAFRIAVSRLMDILPDAKFLAASLVADAEALIGRIHQMSACNAVHAVEARLARWLLRAADCLDSDSIPLTQELMSQILGVQRTTVNLMVRTMAQAGVLRNRRGRVEIIDRVGLESIACECYAHLHACVRPAEVPMRLPSLEPRRNDAVRHDCTSEHRTLSTEASTDASADKESYPLR